MNKIMVALSTLYIFLIPFYDVPQTFQGGVALSGIVMVIIFLLGGIEASIKKKVIKLPSKLMLSFFPLVIIFLLSSLVNYNTFYEKSFNHILFYIYSFVIYSVGSYIVMRKLGTLFFAKILSCSVIIIVIIGFAEILTFYMKGAQAYASFLDHGMNIGIHAGIPRMRSTFNEPSHLALFLIPVYPLIIHSKNKLAIILSAVAIILTISASAYTGLLGSLFLILPLLILKINPEMIKNVFGKLILIIPIIYYISPSLVDVIDKVANVDQVDATRSYAWARGIELFADSPIIGSGLASYYQDIETGVFSWYLQLAIEVGFVGLIALFLFIMPLLFKIVKQKNIIALFFTLAYLLQMVTMNHYYIPGIWILIAFIYVEDIAITENKKLSI